MTILLIMIPLSLIFVVGAGAAFFWAVNHDQFEDMESSALLPVSDDLGRDKDADATSPDDAGDKEPSGDDAAGTPEDSGKNARRPVTKG